MVRGRGAGSTWMVIYGSVASMTYERPRTPVLFCLCMITSVMTGCGLGGSPMPSDFPEDRGEYKIESVEQNGSDSAQAKLGSYLLTQSTVEDSPFWKMKVEHEATAKWAEFDCRQEGSDKHDIVGRGSMACDGRDSEGGTWKLTVEASRGQWYKGKLDGPKAFEISSLGAVGKAPGYKISDDAGIQFAVRPANFAGGAEIWIAHEAEQPIGAVGAAVSLLLFVPEHS